ncbi:hypothetical protein H0H87_000422 [Tephrocybe sp. NHM501043]|nr:hypothetical protein H0H87_000422 [Tephrocybe sp. NHM501043]
MSRVLAIPELLDMVFQFLDEASNASNARVSKQWSEMALDVLWKEVTSLHRLFGLLASLEKSGSSTYRFVRLLEPSDWVRFERYRRRVRKLSYKTKHALHHSVFDDIARSRTSLDILPNMHALQWDASLTLCVIFMHKNLKSLALRLPSDTSHVPRLFEDIISRTPKVSQIDLRFEFSINNIEKDVIRLVSGLPNLRTIILPRFCTTTSIVEATSRLKNLQTLEFQYHDYQGHGEPDDVVDFRPELSDGSFPALWDLSMTITFDAAIKLLTAPFAPSNLTMLHVDSPTLESPPSLSKFFQIIPVACPLLKSLTLVSFLDPGVKLTSPEKEDCVTLDTLRPLLKCPNLVSLEFEHHYPLHLELEDLEEIATSWPGVESLVLNTQPAYMDYTDLTLHALLPFARHCPKLRMLGLFLNATTTDIPTADPASAYQLPYFRALRTLSMGVSLIQEEGAVALFLSQICPLYCTIEKGVNWDTSVPFLQETVETIQIRCEKWGKVEELLPLLTKLRIEERDRAKLLKEEVQDLRIRTEVLMDKFALHGPVVDGCITL